MTWWTDLISNPGGLGATLGAGSSPFITAILLNRLITRGAHLEALAQKDSEIAEVRQNAESREKILTDQLTRTETARGNEQQAKEVERDRADKLATSLAQLTSEFGAVAVHALESMPQIGDSDATP